MKEALKRSEFVGGAVRALLGLVADLRVLYWLAGRSSKIRRYLEAHSVKKLQLGTGHNVLENWLNTDIFLKQPPVVYLNATQRFPFPDATFDYILAEHMIEHIDYAAGQFMLKECFRVLKPGGRVRFATPDLRVLLGLHAREKTSDQQRYVDWIIALVMPGLRECKDVFVINNAFRAWGHCSLYDKETLRHALEAQGFQEIRFYQPGASEDPNLRGLERHGMHINSEAINQYGTSPWWKRTRHGFLERLTSYMAALPFTDEGRSAYAHRAVLDQALQ